MCPGKKKGDDARGIPQGLATSGVLANMYMFDTDAQINACVASVNGRYIRYCDDFIIVVPAKISKQQVKLLLWHKEFLQLNYKMKKLKSTV